MLEELDMCDRATINPTPIHREGRMQVIGSPIVMLVGVMLPLL